MQQGRCLRAKWHVLLNACGHANETAAYLQRIISVKLFVIHTFQIQNVRYRERHGVWQGNR